ncbi:hypothetical protein BGX31_003095 [Mortierella sp. GBA43]|nr:hypothetical protein BGX31_003095 [Mortierella sp. GBA43]
MCRAYPGQVVCIRSGCPYPINVDHIRGIRHPYCSIECAKACGENPRVRSDPALEKQQQAPLKEETGAGCLNIKRLGGKKKSKVESVYPSPPMTSDTLSTSSDDEGRAKQ